MSERYCKECDGYCEKPAPAPAGDAVERVARAILRESSKWRNDSPPEPMEYDRALARAAIAVMQPLAAGLDSTRRHPPGDQREEERWKERAERAEAELKDSDREVDACHDTILGLRAYAKDLEQERDQARAEVARLREALTKIACYDQGNRGLDEPAATKIARNALGGGPG